MSQTDTIMIGIFLDTTKAGVYATASRLATLVGFGLVAINSIVAPMIASLYAQKRTGDLQRMISVASLGSTAFALPVSLVLFLWGDVALALFGDEFVIGVPALTILIVGQFANSFAGPVGVLMSMTGHEVMGAKVLSCFAILNIVLNFLFIPRWGIQGAAVATTVTIIGFNLVYMTYAWRRIGIKTTLFFSLREV